MQSWLDLARLNAPYLMLLAPLAGAALAAVIPNARACWAIACGATLFSAALGADLALRSLLGDAPLNFAQIGIALRADGVGAFAAPLIALAGALVTLAAGALYRAEAGPRVAPFVLALLLCVIAGWIGAAFAADFIGLFIAAETAWLASIGLVALSGERDRATLSGALRMLMGGGAASAFLLLGVGMIARGAGSLDVRAMASASIAAPDLTAVGVGVTLAALAFKAGVAPLHLWIGAAYGRSGALAPLALGAVGSIGAMAALMRVASAALAAPSIGQGISAALVAAGVISVAIASVQAVGARNVRRMAAYAAAAQAGCALVSVGLGSAAGLAAALVQLAAQTATALALFGGAAALGGSAALSALDGLSRRAPFASFALTAGALSLMGAPLTLGFLGRWRLIEAGVGAGWWWASGTVIVASLSAVLYGGRAIERIYFRRTETVFDGRRELWRLALAPALIVAAAAIAIGAQPAELLRAADAAARLIEGQGS